ncbi:MAG: Crp/Fnr family transcriptional regulator [Hyphomicrobiaceae bacterium]|nr:Crp/Fnr family transcriptional regulator [Hyphomicrobiaceae bacterium]
MALEEDIAVLRRVPFFEGFSEEALKLLAFSGENRRFSDGARIFAEGETSEGGLVVLSGALVFTEGDGAAQHFGPATLLGARALFTRTSRPGTAMASGQTETILIRRSLFLRMLAEYPELASTLQDRLSEELAALSAQMAPVGERLRGSEG